jgi:hypothetical protein
MPYSAVHEEMSLGKLSFRCLERAPLVSTLGIVLKKDFRPTPELMLLRQMLSSETIMMVRKGVWSRARLLFAEDVKL